MSTTDPSPVPTSTPELAVSAAWHSQALAGPFRTTAGEPIDLIHRGTWSHGLGPDFQDALIAFGRELRAGSIEVHIATSGWQKHGHQTDPRYNDVILHVVLNDDGAETRRADGALVPVLVLRPHLTEPLALDQAVVDWSHFGGAACAPDLATRAPGILREIAWQCGDLRLQAKSARIEAQFTSAPPAAALYCELMDGLGFSANREPMRLLASLLPLATLESALSTESADGRADLARGLLFGLAGFLPMSPRDATAGNLSPLAIPALESHWRTRGAPWHDQTLPATSWARARVRPANHPVRRLHAGALLVAHSQEHGGLAPALLAPIRAGDDPVAALIALATTAGDPLLGADRASELITNAVLPFALALASHTRDAHLRDQTLAAWRALPAGAGNSITRRAERQITGGPPLRLLGARGHQGLIHLDSTLCTPRRCFECPIARAVIANPPLTDGATPD